MTNTVHAIELQITISPFTMFILCFSRTFGGYADEAEYDNNLKQLQDFLTEQNITVPVQPSTRQPLYYFAGYDSPAKFWNRRNEVWIKAN